MAAVETPAVWVIIMPASIVDRDPHFGRIPMVKAVGTAVVLIPPIVLRVIDIRIVVKPLPVLSGVGGAPGTAIGLLGSSLFGSGPTAQQGCAAARRK